MNTCFVNSLSRLTLLIIFSLIMVACGGGGGSSNNASSTAISGVPASGLTAIAGDEGIMLSWDAVTGADSYNVYRSDTSGAGIGGAEITGVKPPFYDNGLTNGATYYYVVTAVNSVGESAASVEVSATPVDILLSTLTFTDPNLQTCVTDAVVVGGYSYVHELKSLTCDGVSITDLSGIKALTSLTYLYLGNNTVSDVSQLAALTNLHELHLNSNYISDVSPLDSMTGLTKLDVSFNSISDVSPLASLTNLAYLALGDNQISDVSPLVGLTGLTNLYLGYNGITDVSPLASLAGLIELSLENNSITDVSPLASLTGLVTLFLSNNNISDVSPLASLTGLTLLFLDSNSIVDVSPLANLTGLDTLYLDINNIGGQGVGHVDMLATLTSATYIWMAGNTGMSCSELSALITALGSPPVNPTFSFGSGYVAIDGVNCTNP